MHKLAQQYIEKVKEEVLTKLDLRETVYHPATFKAHLDRERFPQRKEYTPNVLGMMTRYKRLVGYEGTEEEYEKLSKEFWFEEIVEDGEDYILFKRYKKVPIELSDDEFWKLVQYAKVDPDGPLNNANEIIEKLDSLSDAVKELSGIIEEQ